MKCGSLFTNKFKKENKNDTMHMVASVKENRCKLLFTSFRYKAAMFSLSIYFIDRKHSE